MFVLATVGDRTNRNGVRRVRTVFFKAGVEPATFNFED